MKYIFDIIDNVIRNKSPNPILIVWGLFSTAPSLFSLLMIFVRVFWKGLENYPRSSYPGEGLIQYIIQYA